MNEPTNSNSQINTPPPVKLQPFSQKVIYVYRHLNVTSHKGWLKVGETLKSNITGNGHNRRINDQNTAANVAYEVLYTTDAITNSGKAFSDHDIHELLEGMDIEREITTNPNTNRKSEWFRTSLDTVIDAIEKYKLEATTIGSPEIITQFTLRTEQAKAIEMTKAYYNSSQADNNIEPAFLWNAKPRFGKTLTAYCFAAEIAARKVLIVTNRPAIADSWYADFRKFNFAENNQNDGRHRWLFTCSDAVKTRLGNHKNIYTREEVNNNASLYNKNFVHFISLQDIKGNDRSKNLSAFKEKNQWIFDLDWDLVIIDESHEGADTAKAMQVFDSVHHDFTLHLSGTPFKALASNRFSANQIFNWSYVDEQSAKEDWPIADGHNPYAELPKMNIFTYQLSRALQLTAEEARNEGSEYAFDLTEFFRTVSTSEGDRFAYEDKVKIFVKNLSNPDLDYPFSSSKNQKILRHSFWLLPGVKACEQMKRILLEDEYFKAHYTPEDIILAAGNGDDDRITKTALDEVRKRIGKAGTNKHPLETRTITLSCGQLTTGVTIPEWSAVFMLNNCKSPALYMQTAFRAQNPCSLDTSGGECVIKENCYVFDFAPDRILQTIAELAESVTHGSASSSREDKVRLLINFLPVIAEDKEGKMKYLDANEVLTIPLRLITEEVVSRGFMSNRLFENIAGIFGCPKSIKDIINKMDEAKGKDIERNPNRKTPISAKTKIWLDKDKRIHLNEDIVISTTNGLFGNKKYVEINSEEGEEVQKIITEAKTQALAAGHSATITNEEIRTLTKKLPKLVAVLPEPEPEPGDPEYHEKEQADDKPTINDKTEEQKVRDRLRGFARTIPSFLMAYGSTATKLENFGDNIPEEVFLELTNITKDEFRQIRDGGDFPEEDEDGEIIRNQDGTPKMRHYDGFINRDVFNSSVAEFVAKRQTLSCYYQTSAEEDIFEYIPPQANNQIFTPKRVVKMMVDILEENSPGIFANPNHTFIDLYMKSGMYITEIVKRIFEQTRDKYPSDISCITHILEHQVYGFAPSAILHAITQNYIFGFDQDFTINRNHFKMLDTAPIAKDGSLIPTINALFGEGQNMKFTAVIGNPPYHYETGRRKIPLYQDFIVNASNPAFSTYSCLVTPDGFIKGGQQLESLRNYMSSNRHLKSVEFHQDPIFPGFAVDAAISLFDNSQEYPHASKIVIHSDKSIDEKEPLDWQFREVIINTDKYKVLEIFKQLKNRSGNISTVQPGIISDIIPGRAPFGLNTKCYKSNKSQFLKEKDQTHYVKILVGEDNQDFFWINPNDDFSYEGSDGRIEFVKLENSEKWKMVFPKAGLVNEKPLPTRILKPGEIFTDKYLCIFANSEEEAKNAEKYFNSTFYRAGLDSKMTSWNLYRQWHSNIPIQDFTSESDIDWSKSIPEIDQQLYKKYHLTQEGVNLIEQYIKPTE